MRGCVSKGKNQAQETRIRLYRHLIFVIFPNDDKEPNCKVSSPVPQLGYPTRTRVILNFWIGILWSQISYYIFCRRVLCKNYSFSIAHWYKLKQKCEKLRGQIIITKKWKGLSDLISIEKGQFSNPQNDIWTSEVTPRIELSIQLWQVNCQQWEHKACLEQIYLKTSIAVNRGEGPPLESRADWLAPRSTDSINQTI